MTLFNILLIVFLGLPLIVVSVLYLNKRREAKKLKQICDIREIRINVLTAAFDSATEQRQIDRDYANDIYSKLKKEQEENQALKLTATNRETHIATLYQELHTANQLNEHQGKILGRTASKLGVERRKTIKLEKLLKECQKQKKNCTC